MKEIRDIYKEAFGTFPDFDDAFFAAFGNKAKTLTVNGKTVSVLFLLPCQANGKKLNYIYAAATAKNERKKGYMRKLIKNVLSKSDTPAFLMPASDELVSFYEKCGFYKAKGVRENGEIKITVTKEHEQLSRLCDNCPSDFTLMFSCPAPDMTFEFPYIML